MPYRDPEKNRIYRKKWYLENRDKVLESCKKYHIIHSEERNRKERAYYAKNRERIRAEHRIYSILKKKERSEWAKNYYSTHPDKKLEKKQYNKIWRQKNESVLKIKRKKYFQDHKKEANFRRKLHWDTNINFKLGMSLRNRLNSHIKRSMKIGYKKYGSHVKYLGCSIAELKMYIEGQFKDGMSWNNWSDGGWHLDHKIPLAFFDLSNKEELLKACHYSNLQPLWAIDNFKKGARWADKIESNAKYHTS